MATAESDDRPLELSGRSWPTLASRTVVIVAGSALDVDETQWRDALVVVESGEVEVETSSGLRHRFGPGQMMWFTGLSLRTLHNFGPEAVVLTAVSRRRRAAINDADGPTGATGQAPPAAGAGIEKQ